MAEREISLSRRVRTELHGSVAAVNGWDFSQRSAREREREREILGIFVVVGYKFRSRTRASRSGSFSSAITAAFSVLCGYCHLFFICQQMSVVKFFGFDACMPWFFFFAVLFLLAELECSLFLVCWKCVLSCCCWVLEVVPKFLWNLCFGIIILFLLLFWVWNLCCCSWNPLIFLARSRSRSS